VNLPHLRYSDLSPDAIKSFHREHGTLVIQLSPNRGKLLRALLDQRDKLERDLLVNVPFGRLLWDHFILVIVEWKARIFHKRLLAIEGYVAAIDASHGWEMDNEGNHIILLVPR
jgi:hypothetical protein